MPISEITDTDIFCPKEIQIQIQSMELLFRPNRHTLTTTFFKGHHVKLQ